MKKIFIITFLFLAIINGTNAQQEIYKKARISLLNKSLNDLSREGIAVDHGHHDKGRYFESDFSSHEIQKLKNKGFTIEIIQEDVAAFYKRNEEKNKPRVAKTEALQTILLQTFPFHRIFI